MLCYKRQRGDPNRQKEAWFIIFKCLSGNSGQLSNKLTQLKEIARLYCISRRFPFIFSYPLL